MKIVDEDEEAKMDEDLPAGVDQDGECTTIFAIKVFSPSELDIVLTRRSCNGRRSRQAYIEQAQYQETHREAQEGFQNHISQV